MDKKLEARVARLEKFIKNEDAELSHLIEATHNAVNDLIDMITNHERQSKFLDMIIHKENKAIDTIIDFIANHYYYDFSKGYLLSKRSIIADEASEVAGALAIYSDWEDKGYFDGDGDFDESVNRKRKQCKNESITNTLSQNEINWICDVHDSVEHMRDMVENLNYKSSKLNVELSDIDDLLLKVTNSLDETRYTLEDYMLAIEEQKTL